MLVMTDDDSKLSWNELHKLVVTIMLVGEFFTNSAGMDDNVFWFEQAPRGFAVFLIAEVVHWRLN